MTAQVRFIKGDVDMGDYTPGADIVCGQVVVANDAVLICTNIQGIASGALGAMAVSGGWFFGTADAAIGTFKDIFWDDTNNKITETASGNLPIGITGDVAAAADGDVIPFYFDPSVPHAKAANVAANATAAATDLATSEALANSVQTTVNAILTSLKNAGLMATS